MLLDKIQKVLADRENNYDHPLDNFQRIANLFNDYLEDRITRKLTPLDIANLMILMKIARQMHKHNEDNYLDIIGYALCAEKIYTILDQNGIDAKTGQVEIKHKDKHK